MNTPENKPQQLQVKYDDATLRGVYSNSAQVQFQREEFLIDFMNQYPPMATLNARVILSPAHAKRLAAVFASVIQQYEAKYGPIFIGAEEKQEIGFTTK